MHWLLSTSLPCCFPAGVTGVTAAASWPAVATDGMQGEQEEGKGLRESSIPLLSHALYRPGGRGRWTGNPLCLEGSAGTHQPPP